jgi:hypothetical protein
MALHLGFRETLCDHAGSMNMGHSIVRIHRSSLRRTVRCRDIGTSRCRGVMAHAIMDRNRADVLRFGGLVRDGRRAGRSYELTVAQLEAFRKWDRLVIDMP